MEGPLPNDEIARFMRRGDILVVPSIYENFGNVALEGLASGCAVIASRCGGLVDLVDPGENGWLVEVGNPDDLRMALNAALDMPSCVEAYKKSGVEKSKSYDWSIIAQRTIQLFHNVIREQKQFGADR